jgi:hypothetical protein
VVTEKGVVETALSSAVGNGGFAAGDEGMAPEVKCSPVKLDLGRTCNIDWRKSHEPGC